MKMRLTKKSSIENLEEVVVKVRVVVVVKVGAVEARATRQPK